jgi:integrase
MVLSALMPQNRLIFRVILRTGARVGDVLALRTEQIKPSFWYTERKTGKRRRMGLGEELSREILEQAGTVWAFPGRDGEKPKTRQAVWADVKRAERAFRLPQNLGTHSARKVYAVRLLQRYGDIERVRRALNHSSDSVTVVYALADTLLERKERERKRRHRSTRT